MDDRFYSAFLPPSVKVCGRLLSEFTLWHHFLLSAAQSPVALGGETISVGDLLVAAKLCSQKWPNRNTRPSLRDIIWRIRLSRNKALFKHEATKLYRWIEENGKGPHIWREPSDGKSLRPGPQCSALVVSLMSRCHMPESNAWNTSLGKAQWMDAQAAQLEGVQINFASDNEINSNFDQFSMTDEEALATFQRDLPANIVQASFDHWKKQKEARNA